jgi:hypothetical protein
MLRQHHARLHHMQIMDLRAVDFRERRGEQICLLLVVAFEADAIARAQHGFKQPGRVFRGDLLAPRQARTCRKASVARLSGLIPWSH